jgi:hypothetical protein
MLNVGARFMARRSKYQITLNYPILKLLLDLILKYFVYNNEIDNQ